MVGNFTYDNWTQGRFLIDGEWVEGIFHGEEFIDLKWENVYRLDQVDDDNIIEHTPKELTYK